MNLREHDKQDGEQKDTIGEKYVEWANRRSDTTQLMLFFITLFLFFGIVVPLLDLANTVKNIIEKQ